MLLELQRKPSSANATIGELFLNGVHECYTLEDVVRPAKIQNETAIPSGGYDVTITFSNRFGKRMPLLESVPNFSGIRIHCGNTDKDTDGCILVGNSIVNSDDVGGSRVAFDELFPKLSDAFEANDPIRIVIKDAV